MKNAQDILIEQFNFRKDKNPSYSRGAFASDIGLSATQLSNVMSGRRGISQVLARNISLKLSLTPTEQTLFVSSLAAEFARGNSQRKSAQQKIDELSVSRSTRHISEKDFGTIASWKSFAILELMKISPLHKNKITQFAHRLGLDTNETKEFIQKLDQLGLIQLAGDFWEAKQDSVVVDPMESETSIFQFHKHMLDKCIDSVRKQNVAERYGYSSVIPFRFKNMDRAKAVINRFQKDILKELSDDEGDCVYGFSLHMFQLAAPTS